MGHTALRGVVRRLTAADRPLLEAHLLRLDVASRRNRFGGAVSEDFLRDYAARAFQGDGVLYGFVESGGLRGAGELQAASESPREAEAAFSVEPGWRRRGVAARLFSRLLDAARNRGVRRIMVVCLPENRAMQRLTHRFEGRIVHLAPDMLGVVPAPPADWLSRWRELADDAASLAFALFDIRAAAIRRAETRRGEKSPELSATG